MIEVADVQAIYQQGLNLQREKKYTEAKQCYKQILEFFPSQEQAIHLLGVIAFEENKYNKAIDLIQHSIKLDPTKSEFYVNLALCYVALNNLSLAIENCNKAIARDKSFAQGYFILGNIYSTKKQYMEAEIEYNKALKYEANNAEAWCNLGNVQQNIGKITDAIESYKTAIKIKPEYFALYQNLGGALKKHGDILNAHKYLLVALKLNPNSIETLENLSIVLSDQGELLEAIKYAEQAMALDDTRYATVAHVYSLYCRACKWDKLTYINKILERLMNNAIQNKAQIFESPMINISRNDDLKENLIVCRSWASSKANIVVEFKHLKEKRDKVTIGYISDDLHEHAVGYLVPGLLSLHDRNKFNINCYYHGVEYESEQLQKIKQSCDKFIDIKSYNFIDTAKKIYKDKVDILIDLKGHTKNNRLEVFALRPAPIQISYLGFPGTTGAEYIDYLIADMTIIPQEEQVYYTEKIIYLPDCYQATDNTQYSIKGIYRREDFGLHNADIVLCCFNQSFKIDKIMYNIWLDILKHIPNSVLWLLNWNQESTNNLLQYAYEQRISQKQIIFSEKLTRTKHLERLSLADIALDTRFYNGHTTTSDALWVGVPVITLKGSHFASRVSTSLLKAYGLEQLITNSLDEYKSKIFELACRRESLQELKLQMKNKKGSNNLFNSRRFASNFDRGLKQIYDRYLNNLKPASIYP